MNCTQEKMLEILEELDSILGRHRIRYYLAYGTALGAVRHKGFIPWDDDVDICIFKEDEGRFVSAMKDLDPDRFFLQVPDTGDFMTSLYKVRMNNTTYVEKHYRNDDIHLGIFVDVFVLESVPDGLIKRQFFRMVMRLYGITEMLYYLSKNNIWRWSVRSLRKCLNKYMRMLQPEGSSELVCPRRHSYGEASRREYFGEPVMMEFEGHPFPVPEKYAGYLTGLYGDYMRIPENPEGSHDIIAMSTERTIDPSEYRR